MRLATEAMGEAAVMQAVSIEALCAARDYALSKMMAVRETLKESSEPLQKFGLSQLEVRVCVHSGDRDGVDIHREDFEQLAKRALDVSAWQKLFVGSGLSKLMDEATRTTFHNMLYNATSWSGQDEKLPEFTPENVEATMAGLRDQRADFFAQSIEAVFRGLSWDYETNAPYQFGEKVIVTWAIDQWTTFARDGTFGRLRCRKLDDLERVLCILDGAPVPDHTCGLSGMGGLKRATWYTCPPTGKRPLFEFKVFKNKNAHVRFFATDLVDEMNRIMSERIPFSLGEGRKER